MEFFMRVIGKRWRFTLCIIFLVACTLQVRGQDNTVETIDHGFSCSQLRENKIAFTVSLCDYKNQLISDILNAELIKYIMKRELPLQKLNYSVDTLFKRHYQDNLIGKSIDSLPPDVLNPLVDESFDYALLVYNFKSKRDLKLKPPPKGKIHFGDNLGFPDDGVDNTGNPGKFKLITSVVSLLDIVKNKVVYRKEIVANKESCRKENVKCMVRKILRSMCEATVSSEECVPCFKIR